MVVGLLAVVRDEGQSLPSFLRVLEDLEVQPGLSSLFCSFYENDSVDQTVSILHAWLRHRRGSLITEKFSEKRLKGRDTFRTQRLAAARNRALDALLSESLESLLILDVDVKISISQILELFRLQKSYPQASMLCASAVQNVPDVLGEGAWSYYDSWALRDLRGCGGITFAANPFRHQQDRWRWMAGLPVPVASAFGGMALLPMEVVRRHNLRWQGDQGCEHWAFCAGARQAGPVLACPTVQPLVVHQQPPQWSLRYAEQVRSQLAA